MSNLSAERINSFPSTKRAAVNKLMTENSVTRLINRLIDKDSYVITTGLEDVDFTDDIIIDAWAGKSFEFVIRGYYFSISNEDTTSGLQYLVNQTGFDFADLNEHTLYARIFIDKTNPDFPELYGQEETAGAYKAIDFLIDDAVDATVSYPQGYDETTLVKYDAPLVRYKKDDTNRYVTLDCLAKFTSKSIADIDGGEIKL